MEQRFGWSNIYIYFFKETHFPNKKITQHPPKHTYQQPQPTTIPNFPPQTTHQKQHKENNKQTQTNKQTKTVQDIQKVVRDRTIQDKTGHPSIQLTL